MLKFTLFTTVYHRLLGNFSVIKTNNLLLTLAILPSPLSPRFLAAPLCSLSFLAPHSQAPQAPPPSKPPWKRSAVSALLLQAQKARGQAGQGRKPGLRPAKPLWAATPQHHATRPDISRQWKSEICVRIS